MIGSELTAMLRGPTVSTGQFDFRNIRSATEPSKTRSQPSTSARTNYYQVDRVMRNRA